MTLNNNLSVNQFYGKSDSNEKIGGSINRITDSAVSFGGNQEAMKQHRKQIIEQSLKENTAFQKKSQFSFGVTLTELIDESKLNRLKFRVIPSKTIQLDRTINSYGLSNVNQ